MSHPLSPQRARVELITGAPNEQGFPAELIVVVVAGAAVVVVAGLVVVEVVESAGALVVVEPGSADVVVDPGRNEVLGVMPMLPTRPLTSAGLS